MSLSKEVYQALESIVGPENISDDPAICEADTKGGFGEFMLDRGAMRPAAVLLPGSTEEVQQIVKVANRYKLPFVPFGTFYIAYCAPNRPNTIMLDLKRMTRLEIDERNLYALCESGVCISQLQAEAMKRGLYTVAPGCGSQASVVANTAVHGQGPLGYRLGFAYRRMLGTEWVLPDGEILRLGSAAALRDYFWGEGPGTDLRGLLRGIIGHQGGLGVVTKMAVKLYPFIPEKLEPSGISPHTTLNLPPNRMKWYNITYPSPDTAINGMYEIAKHEIGAMIMSVPPIFRYVARARGKGANAFWEAWPKAGETLDRNEMIVRVLLVGFTSEKQLAYEEKVLQDIATETGGVAREGRPTDESWIMSADAISIYFVAGAEASTEISLDSLDQALKVGRATAELKKKYTPPLGEDYGYPGWFQVYDLGHLGYLEFLAYADTEDTAQLEQLGADCIEHDLAVGGYPAYQEPSILGPEWFNYHELLERVKDLFDPNGISNPPKPLKFGQV
ncbi:MAG: hypothetical protein COS88_03620 [Chloroflexi bacterium CG07_land_8_20_14_0_80_51_10]|nr:MAG: hypothetical protein COS88_03620 [Chloroflexi bacterium CG07_land_8_20_14_0_80_51_10]